MTSDRREQLGTERCAVCGWPLAKSAEDGCVRGNCSQRPFPREFYDLKRAEEEYGHTFTFFRQSDSGKPQPAAEGAKEPPQTCQACGNPVFFHGDTWYHERGADVMSCGGPAKVPDAPPGSLHRQAVPTRRQIVFNWMMGEDMSKVDGYWGTQDEVDRIDELLAALAAPSPAPEMWDAFDDWCPIKIIDAAKAPKSAALVQAYKTAWEACWNVRPSAAGTGELTRLLRRILDELPKKRDWLDPTLEREAREAIRNFGGSKESEEK